MVCYCEVGYWCGEIFLVFLCEWVECFVDDIVVVVGDVCLSYV